MNEAIGRQLAAAVARELENFRIFKVLELGTTNGNFPSVFGRLQLDQAPEWLTLGLIYNYRPQSAVQSGPVCERLQSSQSSPAVGLDWMLDTEREREIEFEFARGCRRFRRRHQMKKLCCFTFA